VNTLPDHVHFNHSIHIAKGIACVNCHGEIADMALTAKGRALTMRECLECHRDPGPHRVGREEVFLSQARIECGRGALTPPVAGVAARASRGGGTPSTPDLQLPTIHPGPLTNCSTCHH
jgi:Cytochrome c7 and related cytochrome c